MATAVAAVAWVFGDPRFDYRLLVVGAVVPMAETVTGGAWLMHTLACSVALVIVVMAATVGRRPARRRFLALPIGMLLYLVFSAAWNDADTFWWPATGGTLGDRQVPVADRPIVLTVVLEAAGLVAVVYGWRMARLSEPDRRRALLAEGRLEFVVN